MKRFGLLLFLPIVTAGFVFGESSLSPDLRAKVDQAAEKALADTGVPSASVAVVKEGKLAYLHAYGDARLEPKTTARPETRYAVGSISKQFTAAAILMLAEQRKLSLDDPVSRFVPSLTRGNEVTIRQLLSHTSGYQDYWPQDYVPPFMTQPIVADRILDLWARKPLDFEPGTEWQYSNTNFVIAGLIIEKASGEQLYKFLSQNIFEPLGMQSVFNIDRSRLPDADAVGYVRYALGPERVAPKEGAGWLFATGELAMSAEDLAKWDISVIEQRLMKPSSYRNMETDNRLKNGLGTQYGLGVFVKNEDGHRALEHGGETSGFTAENVIFPDHGAAIVVLTNQDANEASSAIERAIASILFESDAELTRERQERTRKIFNGLQNATLDRSLFTANANSYFSEQVVTDFATSLKPLGSPQQFTQTLHRERGGMSLRVYKVQFQQKSLNIWVREMPDGKIEQYQVFAGS
jgi:D-alanyl-D-alanine carboxypeptidase